MKFFHQTINIEKNVIDVNLHVNNVAYVQWMQDCATSHSRAVLDTNREENTWVVKNHTIEYIKQAFEKDQIQVQTWVEYFKRTYCIRHYEFTRIVDNELLVKAVTTYVFFNKKTSKPERIPQSIKELYE